MFSPPPALPPRPLKNPTPKSKAAYVQGPAKGSEVSRKNKCKAADELGASQQKEDQSKKKGKASKAAMQRGKKKTVAEKAWDQPQKKRKTAEVAKKSSKKSTALEKNEVTPVHRARVNFTGAFKRTKMDVGRSASPHFPNDVEMVDANVAEVDDHTAVGLLLNCAVATASALARECSSVETLKSTIESVPRNLDTSPPSQLPIEGEELVQPHSIPSASGDL